MYGKLIDWLQEDRNAWAITYSAIGIIIVLVYLL